MTETGRIKCGTVSGLQLILLLLFLVVPAWAQDDELPQSPGPPKMRNVRRLSDEEKQRILREAGLPPLPVTPEEKKQTQQEWERMKTAWGDKPISIPLSEKELKEYEERLVALGGTVASKVDRSKPGLLEKGAGIVAVIFTFLAAAAYIKLRKEKGR